MKPPPDVYPKKSDSHKKKDPECNIRNIQPTLSLTDPQYGVSGCLTLPGENLTGQINNRAGFESL